MRKFISIFFIFTTLILTANIPVFAQGNKQEVILIKSAEKKKFEQMLKAELVNLSKDKAFMDTLIKNYNDSNKSKNSTFKSIFNLSFKSCKWTVGKIFNFIMKLVWTFAGIATVSYTGFYFGRKIIDNLVEKLQNSEAYQWLMLLTTKKS